MRHDRPTISCLRSIGGSIGATGPAGFRSAATRRLAEFGRDENGAVAVLFGIMITVVLFLAAIAVDGSRFTSEWMRDRQALDAAVLAATDVVGLEDQDELMRTRGEAFYLANRPRAKASDLQRMELNPDTGRVVGETAFDWSATLLRPFGYDKVRLGGTATAVRGGTAEVALVLDNSGSMAGSYIEDLKTAAEDLVNVVFASNTHDGTSVSVVPFAGSVNVGAANRGASWIDNEGLSPLDKENVSEDRTRFQLFDDLNETWGGCVEMRSAPFDTSDTPPDEGTPATLFTPQFAPDEPDDINDGGYSMSNNYLVDDGGTCPKQECTCPQRTKSGACKTSPGWVLTPIDPKMAQARTCKYSGEQVGYASPSGDNCRRGNLSGDGPNAFCTTKPLLPLNTDPVQVTSAIHAMSANGMTNIAEGIAWGWRTLSPAPPFSEGRSYDDHENKKFLVIMTDGENTYTSTSDHNRSRYNALGYAKPYRTPTAGRLGTSYSSSAYTTRMNSKTREVCANAKAEGIKIFTVAFRLESNPTTLNLLQECAEKPSNAYIASDGAALIEVFRSIGREISKLRIAS